MKSKRLFQIFVLFPLLFAFLPSLPAIATIKELRAYSICKTRFLFLEAILAFLAHCMTGLLFLALQDNCANHRYFLLNTILKRPGP